MSISLRDDFPLLKRNLAPKYTERDRLGAQIISHAVKYHILCGFITIKIKTQLVL